MAQNDPFRITGLVNTMIVDEARNEVVSNQVIDLIS